MTRSDTCHFTISRTFRVFIFNFITRSRCSLVLFVAAKIAIIVDICIKNLKSNCCRQTLLPLDSLRNVWPQQHSSNALGSGRSSSAVPMSFRWPSPLRQYSCAKYSGLAFGCQKSYLRTGFPKAFTSLHHRLYWRGLFRSQIVFCICRCRFCNRSVIFFPGLGC